MGKPLPKWAKLTPPKKMEGESVIEEDAFLRTKAYHAVARQMDLAFWEALRQTGGHFFHSEFDGLLSLSKKVNTNNKAAVQNPDETRASKKQRSSANETYSSGDTVDDTLLEAVAGHTVLSSMMEANQFTIQPAVQYDPLLLPLFILDGPFAEKDRDMWMFHLVQSTKQSRPRACTVWLRPEKRTGNSKCSRQEEVMRQCLAQEPDMKTIFSRKRLRNSSLTDILIFWAAHTRAYDEILVFLQVEDGDGLYSKTADLQDFLQWAVERRAFHGLPFTIVFMGQHSFRRPIQLRSSTQSSVGLLVRRLELPSTESVLDSFWEQWSNDCTLFFQSRTLRRLRHTFQNQNRSAVHVLRQLQQEVALQFSAPGSFLMACRLLSSQQQSKRITSLIFDKDFHSLVPHGRVSSSESLHVWLVDCEARRRTALVALRMQKLLYETFNNGSLEPFLLCPINKVLRIDKELDEENRSILISALANLRAEAHVATESPFSYIDLLPGDKEPYEAEIRGKTVHSINELLLLFDQCRSISEAQSCLAPLVHEWVSQSPSPFLLKPMCFLEDDEMSCRPPQPRRDHVQALLELNFVTAAGGGGDEEDKWVYIPGCLYRIILDRVSISESEWFDSFVETFPVGPGGDVASRAKLFHLFGCGVRHLQISGLIRDRRLKGKSGIMYEKAALVWCGGD